MTWQSIVATLGTVFLLAANSAGTSANTVFFDDFISPDPTNPTRKPISWIADNGEVSVIDGNLKVQTLSPEILVRAEADGVSLENVSVRTQVRSTQGAPFVQLRFNAGEIDSGYLAYLMSDGTAAISISGDNFRDLVTAQTEYRPTQEDVVMQFDAIDNELSLYLARPGEDFTPMRGRTHKLSVIDNTVSGSGTVLLGVGALGPTTLSGLFRLVHVADMHIPEPSTLCLTIFSLLGLSRYRNRRL